MVRTPLLMVNFKLHPRASGKNAVKLAETLDEVSKEYGVEIIAAVNPLDFQNVKEKVDIPVFLQHVDAVGFGSHTGRINLEVAAEHEVDGILVNHSERRLTIADIDFLVQRAKELNLYTVVCTNNARVSGAIAFLEPDFIAMEPPELIGGNISVSKARPDAITDTIKSVKSVKDVPVLVGAGVKNGEDVRKAIELGAVGVLVASGVTKAENQKRAIEDLISGLR